LIRKECDRNRLMLIIWLGNWKFNWKLEISMWMWNFLKNFSWQLELRSHWYHEDDGFQGAIKVWPETQSQQFWYFNLISKFLVFTRAECSCNRCWARIWFVNWKFNSEYEMSMWLWNFVKNFIYQLDFGSNCYSG
jgi:hypothetical protein